jgi:hypothetical protein
MSGLELIGLYALLGIAGLLVTVFVVPRGAEYARRFFDELTHRSDR